jgi:hypothetical protein
MAPAHRSALGQLRPSQREPEQHRCDAVVETISILLQISLDPMSSRLWFAKDMTEAAVLRVRFELGDWRGETLSRMRKLIKEADPDVVEEWKWMGTPIWSHDGIICTGESYKNVVKLTFSKGASLKDPARLFNSSLDGNARRAIDIHEGEEVDESAFKALVRQAVALNSSGKSKPSKKAKS